jgi:hypothetical protein
MMSCWNADHDLEAFLRKSDDKHYTSAAFLDTWSMLPFNQRCSTVLGRRLNNAGYDDDGHPYNSEGDPCPHDQASYISAVVGHEAAQLNHKSTRWLLDLQRVKDEFRNEYYGKAHIAGRAVPTP